MALSLVSLLLLLHALVLSAQPLPDALLFHRVVLDAQCARVHCCVRADQACCSYVSLGWNGYSVGVGSL
jgi:hypothetical protein